MINDLTGFPIVEDGVLRVAPFCRLPEISASFGVSHRDILRDANLDPALLSDAENIVGIGDAGKLLAAAVRRTACPHIGILLGKTVGLDTLGHIGVLARGARDVGSALRGLIVALHLHDRATVPTLTVTGGGAVLTTFPLEATSEGAEEIADLTLMACFNIVRELSGPAWHPREVHLARRAPSNVRSYVVALGERPRFDAEFNALIFDASWLSRLVTDCADRVPTRLDAAATRRPLDTAALLRRACVRALIEGNATVERLAVLLGTSRRTLNRKLAPSRTTARQELLRVRLQIAQQLIVATDLPMAGIADLLGYADASAFTRAFRKQVAATPSDWRRYRQNVR